MSPGPPSPEAQLLGLFDAPSPSASVGHQGVSNIHPHFYFQQTTSSTLYSTVVFTFLGTVFGLALFSWVRTRRSSIYGSRQFFVKEEHRAEVLSDSFLGWIPGLFFLERTIERRLEAEVNANAAICPQGQAAVGGGGGSSNSHVTQLHSLTEKDSRIGGGGEGGNQRSNNKNSSACTSAFGSSKLAGIRDRLTKLLVADKSSVVSIIQPNSTSVSTAIDMRGTKEEVGLTHDEPSAMASTTLKPSQQQAQSTMSVSSAISGQHQHQQPATSRHMANGLSSSTSLSLSNKASALARQEIIAKIGLDHYLLIRFLKMLFAVSVILGVVAISILVPLYVIRQTGEDLQGTEDHLGAGSQPMRRVEILQIGNVIDDKRLWATVLAVTFFSGKFQMHYFLMLLLLLPLMLLL